MKETDIVQALRCCAEGECKDCAMHEDKQRCQENLLDKAAEAIERLTAENAALREKQRWIPVTERMPEEIKAPFTEDTMINLAAQALGVEPSRLRELAEADKDGRVVVLPCKVGEKLWVIGQDNVPREMELEAPDIRTVCTDEDNLCMSTCNRKPDGYCAYRLRNDGTSIGKNVFLTREEAERAMEEMEAKKDGNETSM